MSQLDELRVGLEARTTEELVSILRDRDEEQWRPEVFDMVASILATREISPAMVSAMGPEGRDVMEGRALATVGHYFSPPEAHAARMALEAAGLQAWVIDESLGTVYGIGVGARLQVALEDEDASRTVLDGAPVSAAALPAELAEPPCPQCRSRDISQTAVPIDEPEPSRVRGGRRRRQWYYDCAACGHRWRADD